MRYGKGARVGMIGVTVSILVLTTVAPSLALTPRNDDFHLGTPVGTLPFRDELDTSDATSQRTEPDCFGKTATVWYSMTPSRDMEVSADTFGSGYDTNLAVYRVAEGATPTLDNQMACVDDFGSLRTSKVTFFARNDQTYLMRVGASGPFGGSLVFTVNEQLPPANDNVSTPTTVGALPYTDVTDSTQASVTASDPTSCGPATLRTIWYAFTPDQDGYYEFDTVGSIYDTTLSIFTGSPPALNREACDDNARGLQSAIVMKVEAGTALLLMVSATSPRAGTSVLNVTKVPKPSNDEGANANDLSTPGLASPITASQDITGATSAANDPDPSCSTKVPINSVWFSFTPEVSASYLLSLSSQQSDTALLVLTGTVGSLEEVACADARAVGGEESTIFDAREGRRHFILVQTSSMATIGRTFIGVQLRRLPDPLEVTLDVDPLGFASSLNGRSVIQGDVTCSRASTFEVSVEIEQRYKDRRVVDSASDDFDCNSAKAWSVDTGRSRFRAGEATFDVRVRAIGRSDSPFEEFVSRRSTGFVKLSLCSLIGTANRDRLSGNPDKRDKICALSGDDRVYGFGGDDKLLGGGGEDTLRGGAGDDFLYGGDGNDELVGGPGTDTCRQAKGKGTSKECEKG